jgi:hypothetical protein
MRKTFKKPDLHAPRFRQKRMNPLTRELFERFKERFPEHGEISLQQFKEVIKTFNGNLYQGMIDNRDGVELPEGLGYIFLGSCPPAKKQNIDIVKSLEYGIVAKHQNWDSDSKLLKIFYTNQNSKFPFQNKQVWAFKAVKQFRKAASEAYKMDWPKYIVVDSQKKISAMFAQYKTKDFTMAPGARIPEGFEEFKNMNV